MRKLEERKNYHAPVEIDGKLEWNITQAAKEFDETAEAIRKGLRNNDIEVGEGWRYSTREIHVALAGDERFERTRVHREKADALIRQRMIDDGTLVEWERVVNKLNQKLKLPTINALDNAPNDEARDWIEKTLKPIWMQALDEMKKEIVEEYKRSK